MKLWFGSVSISCKDESTSHDAPLCSTFNLGATSVTKTITSISANQLLVPAPSGQTATTKTITEVERHLRTTIFQMTS